MSEHNANRYASGCRCDVCRTARTAHSRKRRAAAREARLAAEAEGRTYVVDGIAHGIGGYRDKSCRCLTCRIANAASSARSRARKKGAA